MTSLRKIMDAMKVRVTSPDGGIEGILYGGQRVEIKFFNDNYYDYDKDRLCTQLEGILRLWATGHQRGRIDVLQQFGRTPLQPGEEHWNKNKRDMRKEAAESEVSGFSVNESIRIDSVGLRSFSVQFEDQILDELNQDEFNLEFTSAVADMITDWRMVTSALRKEYSNERR